MPVSNILYNLLWVQEDERSRIVNPVEKKRMQQGLNLRLPGERPAPKPLNPRTCSYTEDIILPFG
jgi:hypothetical protein